MKTVLQVIPHLDVGGVQKVVAGIAKNLNPERWRAVIIVLSPLSTSTLEKDLRQSGIEVRSLNCRRHTSIETLRRLRKTISETGANVVHLHGHTFRCGAPLSVMTRAAFVYTVHGELSWSRYRVDNILQACLLRLPIYTTAVSGAAANATFRTIGLRVDRLVENGVEPPTTETISAAATPGDGVTFTFAMVSRLAPRKGHEILLKAFQQVIASDNRCRLVLIGDGPLRARHEQTARELGVVEKVTFAGEISDVYGALSRVDALVHPSLTEGSPMCCIEAMLLGRPIVASSAGGLPELVVDGETGYIRPIGDVTGIAQAMLTLSGNRELARSMGEKACARGYSRYTAEKMAANFEAVYQNVTQKQNGA